MSQLTLFVCGHGDAVRGGVVSCLVGDMVGVRVVGEKLFSSSHFSVNNYQICDH